MKRHHVIATLVDSMGELRNTYPKFPSYLWWRWKVRSFFAPWKWRCRYDAICDFIMGRPNTLDELKRYYSERHACEHKHFICDKCGATAQGRMESCVCQCGHMREADISDFLGRSFKLYDKSEDIYTENDGTELP